MNDEVKVCDDKPAVFAIEMESECDGQRVRFRYEAPTAEEVIRLARLDGHEPQEAKP